MGKNREKIRGAGSEKRGASQAARVSSCAARVANRSPSPAFRNPHSAFTLTELLIVITIIAILAGLGIPAVINALNTSKQVRISLEINELSRALEDLKNDYGAYPPNVYGTQVAGAGTPDFQENVTNLTRFMRQLSSRAQEFNTNQPADSGYNNLTTIANVGLSPAEAVVFWLQGFSSDLQRPLTGGDLEITSVELDGSLMNNVITIDSVSSRFPFDRTRLRISRDEDGTRRFLEVYRVDSANNAVGPFQIQLYEYLAPGSEEPYVYFDTSRYDPLEVVNKFDTTEFFYSSLNGNGNVYPMKQLKPNAPSSIPDMPSPKVQFLEYVNPDRFQILHTGIDGAWGNFENNVALNINDNDSIPQILFPTGPFIGDVADTVSNFTRGSFEDAQE